MENVQRRENLSEKANCLSKFLFWYLNDTLSTGLKRQLNDDDIFQIRESDSSKVLCSQLESIWLSEVKRKTDETSGDVAEPILFNAILRMCQNRIILIGLCLFLRQATCIAQCVFFRYMIDHLVDDTKNDFDAIIWTIGIALCLLLQHVLHNLSQYIGLKVGAHVKSAVVSLLYKKVLQIPEGSLRTITTNHVSNLISDSNVFIESFTLINFIWIAPFVLIAITVILWIDIGPTCLAGIAIVLILIPVQLYIQRFLVESCGFKPSKRETIMTEVITRMQAIKLYRLEGLFNSKIKYVRKEEIESSKKYIVVCVFTHALSGVIWFLFLLVTYSIYWNIGLEMNISSVLLNLSLSFTLYQTLALYFPTALQRLRILNSNSKKIQTFLKSGPGISEYNIHTNKIDDISLSFQNVTASWYGNDLPTLQNVSFKVCKANSLVMIVGPPGSGKSSILLTAINELKVNSGKINLNGSISYAAQNTWLFPGTIRDNIVFGNIFNENHYNEVIYACCLSEDVASFKDGDLTLIGLSDTSLSDELKAKICIARAVYHRASIYLFDNLLSLISFDVGKSIFDRCVRGLLQNKMVIIVTSQIQYLDYATNILCMNGDGTTTMGSLIELSQEGVDIVTLLHPESREKQWDEDSAIDTDSSFNSGDDEQEKSRILGGVSLIPTSPSTHNFKAKIDYLVNSSSNDKVTEEISYIGFWYNLMVAMKCLAFFVLVLLTISGQIFLTLTDCWVLVWSYGENQRLSNTTSSHKTFTMGWYFQNDINLNFYLFVGLVLLAMILNFVRTMYFHVTMVRCACEFHDSMVEALLNAPMSFFDKSSVKDILSRFTNDIHFVDVYLPTILCEYAHFILFILVIVIINCVNIPVLVAVFIPSMVLFYCLKYYYTKALQYVRNLETNSQHPVHTHISSTFSGITTIRSFGAHGKVVKEFNMYQDHHNETWFMMLMIRTWIAQRISFIVVLVSIITFFAPIVAAEYMIIDPILTCVSLVHIFTINELFQWYMWKHYDIDTLMSVAERLFEYTGLDGEDDYGDSIGLRETWPEIGLISGEGASFAYNITQPYVLRRLYFCIRPKEKIAIVGNPGSGKTSFILMLFHMAKLNGVVCIDGYPIKDLALEHLRKTISIIPEDPVIFSTSLRQNLDPNMQYSDGDIWEVLDDVQMKELFLEYPDKLDTIVNTSKFNIQERKLICLARVMLEKRKILVIDGDVQSSDHKTERIIQRAIREKFKDATVLMVAYRLNTIMDLDRVMVIDKGKIVEFDEPFALLQNSSGFFRKLVDQAGKTEAARLEVLAEEARKLRHVILLQNQVAFPGSNLTCSKSKNEILKHFGTRVIYETTL